MSFDNALVFLALSAVLIAVCVIFAPLRFYFCIEHHTQWSFSGAVGLWHMKKQLHLTGLMEKRMEETAQHSAVQLHRRPTLQFLHSAMHIAAKYLTAEELQIHCRIGLDRADYTAYCYGLFWTVLSVLPIQWVENSEIQYEPDFHHQRQDVQIRGIIRCRIGQLISILIAWIRLIVQMMPEYNRKEQKQYENGLRRWTDGDRHGKYQKHGGSEYHNR